jgi:hypothetical protein
MFVCLVPIFGMIPATITLTRQRSSQQLRHVSQVAIALMVTWAIGYSAMGGMPTDGEQIQIISELLKASLSSGYFGLCIYLMYRLHRQQPIQLPWLNPQHRDRLDR